MKKATKIALIIACIFVLSGVLVSFSALVMVGFDLSKLNSYNLETNEYTVEEEFSNIDLKLLDADIELVPATDGVCRVVCVDDEKVEYLVSVIDGTLTVTYKDTRAWYDHIGISWGGRSVTIYLPQMQYDNVRLGTVNGDISVSTPFSFENLTVTTTNGDVALKNLTVQSLNINLTNGDVSLSKTLCEGRAYIKTVNGDVGIAKSDAATVEIKTTNGDVKASFLTSKTFVVSTVNGDVSRPHGTSGGKCKVTTTNGDIRLSIIE
ncbi:MAG: DUF4097 family beta strand repeat protein [Clostridia bacterium]|nr:DUF4097 family beta strand repeat protein [Clostridia bacterium]